MKVLKIKDAIRTPFLTNDDLSSIVNGFTGTTPLQDTFASTFTQDKITNCFSRVGCVLFTRNCLKGPYICHGLGEEVDDTVLQNLVQVY